MSDEKEKDRTVFPRAAVRVCVRAACFAGAAGSGGALRRYKHCFLR